MENLSALVAAYGAVLSTVLALAKLVQYLSDRPRASVFVHSSNESWPGRNKCTITLSNTGSHPIVITRLIIDFLGPKGKVSDLIERKIVDHKDLMDPALKSVPVAGLENTTRRVPNVIHPGNEYFAYLEQPNSFDPTVHLIKVTAFIRNSSRKFVGWGKPTSKEAR